MNWVKKHKLLAVKAIQFEGCLYIELEDLWNALHSSFNSAQSQKVDIYFLDEILDKAIIEWALFSKEELTNAIEKCNNSLAPSSDKLIWSHIKTIIKSKEYISKFIDITNACINLGHWLSHFKISYNSSKSFRSIVLLNTIGKLFEKMIGECFQFHTISNNFIYPY